MKIRRLSDGQSFDGPDGSQVPSGFELVPLQPDAPRPPAPTPPMQDPFAGGVSGYLAGNIKRNWPQVEGTAAAGIPGEGLAMAAVRPLAAAALTKAGGKGTEESVESALSVLVGQTIGGIIRPFARTIGAATDRTIKKLTDSFAKTIPEYAGSTPADTINRILGGEGMRRVSEGYGDVRRRLWEQQTGSSYPEGKITDQFRAM